jgi:hypothetical protein
MLDQRHINKGVILCLSSYPTFVIYYLNTLPTTTVVVMIQHRHIQVFDIVPFDSWRIIFNTLSEDIRHKIFLYCSVCKTWNKYIFQSKEKLESSTFRQFGLYLRDKNDGEKKVLFEQWALFLSTLSVNMKIVSLGNSHDDDSNTYELNPLKMVFCNLIIEKNLFTTITFLKVHDIDDDIINKVLPSLPLLGWLQLTKCSVTNEGIGQCTTNLTHLGLLQCTDLTKSLFCESKWLRSLMSLFIRCDNNDELLEGAVMNDCLENLEVLRVGYTCGNVMCGRGIAAAVHADDNNVFVVEPDEDESHVYYDSPSLTAFTSLKTLILDDPRMVFVDGTSISSLTNLRVLCLNVSSDVGLNDSITLLTNLRMLAISDYCIDCEDEDDEPTVFSMIKDLTNLTSFIIHFENSSINAVTTLESLYMNNAQFHYTKDEYPNRSLIHVKRINAY